MAMSTIKLKEKVIAQVAPLTFAKVMQGDTNVSEKLFFTQVMRLGGLFKKLAKSDRNKYLERGTPFTNINLSHVTFNVALGYQVEKPISMFVKSINGDTSVTAQDCIHIKNNRTIIKV